MGAGVWSPLLNMLGGIAAAGAVVLAIGLILAGLAVYQVGASNALAFFRGEGKFYGGRFYGNDVVRAAMADVNNKRRNGVMLDSFSNAELDRYQYGEDGKGRIRSGGRSADDRQYWNIRRENERSFWRQKRDSTRIASVNIGGSRRRRGGYEEYEG